ncbi:MAG: glycosyltransferase [Phycisphaeraceae bacterium]|nr:MAG: glycosyltransferase [Phycisphaeraceae bacterium]
MTTSYAADGRRGDCKRSRPGRARTDVHCMELSILIPTHGRPEKLGACIAALARQTMDPGDFEVIVGIDGPDRGEAEATARAAGGRIRPRVEALPKRGPAATRNGMLELARGRFILLLNDDVVPDADCAAAHVRAQAAPARSDRPAMVLGSAPWRVHENDTLFDALVRETSLIFFYDRMTEDEDPERDWGFRHAWTLNLSAPTAALRAVGGFCESLRDACYEDLEMAWRVQRELWLPVLHRPEAIVTHDHRVTPDEYMERERRLGRSAWDLATVNPGCAQDVFRRDVASDAELEDARRYIDRDRPDAARGEEALRRLAAIPTRVVDSAERGRLLRSVYELHLPMKRRLWRMGLVEGAGVTNGLHATR